MHHRRVRCPVAHNAAHARHTALPTRHTRTNSQPAAAAAVAAPGVPPPAPAADDDAAAAPPTPATAVAPVAAAAYSVPPGVVGALGDELEPDARLSPIWGEAAAETCRGGADSRE